MLRVQVQPLVRKLRLHMSHSQKKSNIKQKKYCNKFNKDLKKSICVFKTLNGLLRWLGGKSPPTSAVAVGDPGSILGQEDPLEE